MIWVIFRYIETFLAYTFYIYTSLFLDDLKSVPIIFPTYIKLLHRYLHISLNTSLVYTRVTIDLGMKKRKTVMNPYNHNGLIIFFIKVSKVQPSTKVSNDRKNVCYKLI